MYVRECHDLMANMFLFMYYMCVCDVIMSAAVCIALLVEHARHAA